VAVEQWFEPAAVAVEQLAATFAVRYLKQRFQRAAVAVEQWFEPAAVAVEQLAATIAASDCFGVTAGVDGLENHQ
jgi:hypothetical protein